jgi:hypothetical protein
MSTETERRLMKASNAVEKRGVEKRGFKERIMRIFRLGRRY